MRKSILSTILTMFGLLLVISVYAQPKPGDAILGKWLNEDKDAHVQIYQEGGKYFGKVVWLNEPNEEDTGLA